MDNAVIINPHSAAGETIKVWRRIKSQVLHRLGGIQVFSTESPGDATKFAQEVAQQKFKTLIIMGGDGTIHEVVNGLFDDKDRLYNPKMKVGIINSGRGCDYIKSLHLPTDPREAVSVIVDDRTRKVDVGIVRGENRETGESFKKYFVNSCSFGLGGDVASSLQTKKTILPPFLSYFVASTTKFFVYEPYNFTVQIDDQDPIQGPFMNMFLCNGRFSGGGMYWAPQAQIDDGRMDLVLVRPISKVKMPLLTHKVYDGSFQTLDEVSYHPVKKLRVSIDRASFLELDGEVYKTTGFEAALLHQTLEVIVP